LIYEIVFLSRKVIIDEFKPGGRYMGSGKSGNPLKRNARKRTVARAAVKRRNRKLAIIISATLAGASALVLLIVGFSNNSSGVYDLSRVGNGIPAVVQVHDPNCPICVQLRGNIIAIADDFDNQQLQLLVADLNSDEGRSFAERYNAGFRTLLYFNPAGDLVDLEVGLQSSADLVRRFREHQSDF
jgi:hypothetical protein